MMEHSGRVFCVEEPWFPGLRARCSQDCWRLQPDFPRVLGDQTDGPVVPRSPQSNIPLLERWVMNWILGRQAALTQSAKEATLGPVQPGAAAGVSYPQRSLGQLHCPGAAEASSCRQVIHLQCFLPPERLRWQAGQT